MTRFNDTGLVRFTQYYVKGDSRYGEIVRAALITKLTPYEVEETYNVSWVASLPSEMWPECVVELSYRCHTQSSADQCVCVCVCVCVCACACVGITLCVALRMHVQGGHVRTVTVECTRRTSCRHAAHARWPIHGLFRRPRVMSRHES